MVKWGTPQTAEELAAQPQRLPYYDLLLEYAERTGKNVAPVSYVTPSGLKREALDDSTCQWVLDQWKAGERVEDIWRALRDVGVQTSPGSLYRTIQRLNRRQSSAKAWD